MNYKGFKRFLVGVAVVLAILMVVSTAIYPLIWSGLQVEAASKGLATFGKLSSADRSWAVSNTADGGIGTYTSTTGEESYWVLAEMSGYSYHAGDLLSIKYDGVEICEEEIVLTDNSSNVYLDKIDSQHQGYVTFKLPEDTKNVFKYSNPTRVRIKGEYRNAAVGSSFSFGGFEIHRSGTLPSWDNGTIPEYNPDAIPHGIAVTYYDDIYSRGFAWSTDNTVNSSALYIVQKSGNMTAASVNWNSATRVNASSVQRTDSNGAKWNVFKAHVTGLTPGATYFYRVGGSGGYSSVGTLQIENGSSDVTFIHLTDSQESSKAAFDRCGTLLAAAKAKYPNAAFVAFSGDMTNYSYSSLNMKEWIWGLDTAAQTLMNTPIAPSSGNHDSYDYSFVDRFDINYADYVPGSNIDLLSGGSYYYTYGSDVLFINLNTNINTYAPEFESQLAWLRGVLETYSNYKWKIVQIHKGALSTGKHTIEYDCGDYRKALCPIFAKYKVDLVLQGHDHVYTRTASYAWDDAADVSNYSYDYDDQPGNVNPAASFDGENRLMNYESAGTHYVTINSAGSQLKDVYDGSDRDANIHTGYNPFAGNDCDIQPGLQMYGIVRIRDGVLCYDAYTFNAKTKESTLYDTFAVDKGSSGSGANSGLGDSASGSGSSGQAAGSGSSSTQNSSGSGSGAGLGAGSGAGVGTQKKYSNEWVDGKWYNADGVCDYAGTLTWKCNATGWWVEDTEGWYPVSQWQKIDGKWYYFLDSGYMDYSEYRDGCWLGSDGSWVEEYYGGHWSSDSTGWWYEDAAGWYPQSQYLWIDGTEDYFNANGYL